MISLRSSNADGVEVLIGSWPYGHISSKDDGLNTTTLVRKSVVRVILHPHYQDGQLGKLIRLGKQLRLFFAFITV